MRSHLTAPGGLLFVFIRFFTGFSGLCRRNLFREGQQ
jgi:hypothetical protein